MKLIPEWLENKLAKQRSPVVTVKPGVRKTVTPEAVPSDDYTIETSFDPAVPGRISSETPGKNVLLRNNSDATQESTEPLLKLLNEPSTDADAATGFNPYDTVVLHDKPGVKKR